MFICRHFKTALHEEVQRTAKQGAQAQGHMELDVTPRRTHNEWLQWGVKGKHGKRILTHG